MCARGSECINPGRTLSEFQDSVPCPTRSPVATCHARDSRMSPKPATVGATSRWIGACTMPWGIKKKRTIVIMIASLATIGVVVASLSATNATQLLSQRPPKRAPTAIAEPFVKNTRTPAAELSPGDVTHATVLQIDTDMRTDGYDIVIDGWVAKDELAEIRMWWLNPGANDERSPFGRGVTRYVDIGYDRLADDGWRVRMRAGKKQYSFEVERHDDGKIIPYAAVDTGGGLVEHCRITKSKLKAKKFLGLPTGLDEIAVHCVDADGGEHDGTLRAKKVK